MNKDPLLFREVQCRAESGQTAADDNHVFRHFKTHILV